MGHSSITVTFDRYGHLFPENLDRLAEGLGDLPTVWGCRGRVALPVGERKECPLTRAFITWGP
jgi:hypothetical protein